MYFEILAIYLKRSVLNTFACAILFSPSVAFSLFGMMERVECRLRQASKAAGASWEYKACFYFDKSVFLTGWHLYSQWGEWMDLFLHVLCSLVKELEHVSKIILFLEQPDELSDWLTLQPL